MNEGNPYHLFTGAHLRKVLEEKVELIKHTRRDVEMIEMLLRDKEDPVMSNLLSREDREQLLTSGGTVRDLVKWSSKILKRRMKVMSSSQIADVMYSYSWPIDIKVFRRRVVVAVSAEANRKDEENRAILVSGLKADNREVLWALPLWMYEGKLMDQYKPWTP